MSNQVLLYLMGGVAALFAIIVVAFLMINKKLNKSEYKQLKQLREGTKQSAFSSEILYQKLYVYYVKIPFIKRYALKLRRRLEILNIDDEYLTRKQVGAILTKAIGIILPLTIVIIAMTHSNYLLMCILLIFEVFLLDTLIDRNGR